MSEVLVGFGLAVAVFAVVAMVAKAIANTLE